MLFALQYTKKMNKRFEDWLRKTGSKQFAGVEIVQWNSTPIFHVVVLEIVKEEVVTVDKILNCRGFEELNSFFEKLKNEKNIPLHLMLSQRGIIHKQVEHIGNNPLEQVLPNAKSSEFQFQIYDFVNIISVVRQEAIEPILIAFETNNFHVLNLSLGDFGLYHLLPFINNIEEVQTATHQFIFEKTGDHFQLESFEKKDTDSESTIITLGEEQQDSRLLGAFAAAFDGLMLQTELPKAIDLLENSKVEFVQKQLFKIGGFGVLGVFMVALLINFLLFTNYTDKNRTLQMQVNLQQSTLQQLDSLKKEVEGKQAFLKDNTLNQNSKISYYADEIARTLPSDIQLTTLNLFPKQKEKRSDKTILPRFSQEIIIKGKTDKSLSFNDWKKALENLDWVKSVQIIGFGEENGISVFEVMLTFE
jgi:Tfp pilus assembly protein PilN